MRVGGRRLLAVLAGGVVLAGGGVTTLAAWQDQTYDRAPLTLSKFNVQQTVDPSMADAGFVEAEDPTAPTDLALKVGSVPGTLLSPDTASTGWVGLRVDAGSVGGTVKLEGATVGADPKGLAPQLQYQAVSGVTEATCRSGVLSAGSSLVADGSSLTTGSGSASFHLDAGTNGAAGPVVGVCVKLSLRSTITRALSGSTVSPVWKFSATSDS